MITNLSKNNLWRISFWVILLLVSLIVGSKLRLAGYGSTPDPYIILDEHTNVWHGVSIRRTGVPAAWSILGFYVDESRISGAGGRADEFSLSVDGKKPKLANFYKFPKPVIAVSEFDFGRGLSHTRLVQPYLDHPPFGAIILSLFVPKEATTFGEVTNYSLRRSAIFVATLTQILIFILALQITKKPLIGIISSTVYGTVPSYLLLSRYALLENILSPLAITGLILIILARERLEKIKSDKLFVWLLVLAGVVNGLGALTKLVGWIFVLANFILLYVWKFKRRHILTYVVPAFFVGALYFVWGFYLSPKLLIDLFITQTQRDFIGAINLLVTFFRVSIYRFPLDGWWIGGFISLLFIPKNKKYLPLGVGVLATLFSALCIVGTNYPWYFIPLIPFMSISVAILFYKFATKPTFISAMLIFFTFVSSSFYWGFSVYQKIQPFNIYRLIFMIFLTIASFLYLVKINKKYNKIWYLGVIILMLALFILNRRSMFFILENWGKLPLIYTPGTF